MPEPGKKRRTRKSTSRVSKINETNGALPEQSAPAAEAPFVENAENAGIMVQPWWETPTREQPVESNEVELAAAPEPTVGIDGERGLEDLLRDDFINQMVHGMTKSKVLDSLVEEFTDKLKDALAGNAEFRQRLVNAVVSTETFRSKLVRTMSRNSG